MSFSDIFSGVGTKLQEGATALVQAKVGEAVDRLQRKATPTQQAVNAATVAPVMDVLVREPVPTDVEPGMPTWAKGALIAAGVLAALLIVKRVA